MNKKELVCYESDASGLVGTVKKVVFPRSINEVETIVKESDLDIVPRGAGSGLVGGCVPNDSIVVDMGYMNKIIKFNPARLIVEVEAGITIKELNEKLNQKKLEFPIIPSNQGISTIGGMIATNAIGSRSMRYGNMKDYVEEVTLVSGRGEIMKVGKADISEVCGMEGTTGIIISAVLKVVPQLSRSASIFQGDSLEEVMSITRRLKLEKEICSLEFFTPQISKILGFPEKYHILIGFDSQRGKIQGEEYHLISKLKHRAYSMLYSQGYTETLDPKFFFDKLIEFMVFLESKQIPYIGYLGQGIIFPFFKKNEEAKKEEVIEFIQKMSGKFCVYGFGLKMKRHIESFERRVLQRVKLRYDPFCKLNKGKLMDIDSEQSISARKIEDNPRKHLRSLDEEDVEELKKLEDATKFISSVPIANQVVAKKVAVIKEDEQIDRPLASDDFDDILNKEFKEEAKPVGGKKLSPSEDLNEFIKEVEITENSIKKEEVKAVFSPKSFQVTENPHTIPVDPEIIEEIKDYEQTYNSEFSQERMKKIEDFAKNVAKDTYARHLDYEMMKKPFVSLGEKPSNLPNQREPLGNNPPSRDFATVNQIMTNRVNSPSNIQREPLVARDQIRSNANDVFRSIMNTNYSKGSNTNVINKPVGRISSESIDVLEKAQIEERKKLEDRRRVEDIMKKSFGFGNKSNEEEK